MRTRLNRRDLLRLTAVGAAAATTRNLIALHPPAPPATNLYANLLQTWCDGLLAHQVTAMRDPGLYGGLLCPACGLVHGRCGDAMYPLLHMAHATGEQKYLHAATLLYDWAEQNVSRPDGSWINDVQLSSWKGITVFHTIALAESLRQHGDILSAETRKQWTARLIRAADFLLGFLTIETGNINYPITAAPALFLCGDILDEPRYFERSHALAAAALDCFTTNGLLFGEGHPIQQLSPKGCRPVDLGYNVEESLPALAQYALLSADQPTNGRVVSSLQAHMEFMLPNGAWDNSWGTRNYKWSWWGSRTSDGCFPALLLLADQDPRFREAAWRNLELMAACTHEGLLYGGPDYFLHGDRPCIHHTFTHAKALATVLDQAKPMAPATRLSLPRDTARGLTHFPEIGTYLASIGPWRATVTEYDWEYIEHVQSGSGSESGGGHVSGGALSLLYHQTLGAILVASMTEYEIIEIANQQIHLDTPHMPLTPRIELVAAGKTYTNLNDFAATLIATASPASIHLEAAGRLLTAAHHPIPAGDILYRVTYTFTGPTVALTASATGNIPSGASLRFILPVVSRATETVANPNPTSVTIVKPAGAVTIRTDARFEPVPKERTFNLVPGFECVPLIIPMQPGKTVSITLDPSA